MGGARTWILVGTGAVAIVALVLAAALGWSEPLVTCGADGAVACATWPPLPSFLALLCLIVPLVVLAAWHIKMWRSPAPTRRS